MVYVDVVVGSQDDELRAFVGVVFVYWPSRVQAFFVLPLAPKLQLLA